MSNRTAQRAKGRRPQSKSQRRAYAKRCSWQCPFCRHKNTQRSRACGECGFKKDGLNRNPAMKDILRAQGVPYSSKEDKRDEMVGRYEVQWLVPQKKGADKWELNAAFETPMIALQYGKMLGTLAEEGRDVRVMDTEEDEEMWRISGGYEVVKV